MARSKYTFFASKAKKDGYVQIAKIFEETAANEKEHAKIWFKLLHDGGIARYCRANLKDCRRGRKLRVDRHVRRPSPKRPREEGFDHIAYLFEMVGEIEKEHEERYRKLLTNMSRMGMVFSRDGECMWQLLQLRPHPWLARKRPRSARSARILKRILS